MHARKRFGQHFLHDRNVIGRIIAAIAPMPGQHFVEIGPGHGALTESLAQSCASIDAIEIDRDLAGLLCSRFEGAGHVHIHQGDALQFDLKSIPAAGRSRLRVVGNLPYNISTPLLFHLLGEREAIVDMHFMLQREVIERMTAPPGNRRYGRLTVMLAPYANIHRLFDIGPGAFTPAPKVWSSVVRIDVLEKPRFAVDQRYARLVTAAFAMRRKTLRNSLRELLDAAQISACGIDPGARAESLAPQQFATLAQCLQAS
ncbi:MAG: 16S rRNA (adenine(1518)-N(6)/adenine(1519)-N(6))-dimethyltransferase RsmA [Steroidobacteraceae bacterium]